MIINDEAQAYLEMVLAKGVELCDLLLDLGRDGQIRLGDRDVETTFVKGLEVYRQDLLGAKQLIGCSTLTNGKAIPVSERPLLQ